MTNLRGLLLGLLVASTAAGCASTGATSSRDGRPTTAYMEEGIASWYGPEIRSGSPTASGERYRESDYTAAHKKLPFGTRVLVENLRNGQRVIVRINDRGPYSRGRIIDLSGAAARAVRMIEAGVVPVRIIVVP